MIIKFEHTSGNLHNQNIVDIFNSVMNDMLILDILREHNNSCKNFTWNSKTPLIARRLDYIFIPVDLLAFAYIISIQTFIRTAIQLDIFFF